MLISKARSFGVQIRSNASGQPSGRVPFITWRRSNSTNGGTGLFVLATFGVLFALWYSSAVFRRLHTPQKTPARIRDTPSKHRRPPRLFFSCLQSNSGAEAVSQVRHRY